jgi:hypothetical protein
MTKFRLQSPQDQSTVWDAILATPIDGSYVVTIAQKKETRSQAQSRLRWLWMTQLEKQLIGEGVGRTKEQWNSFFKIRFMKAILVEMDADYADFFDKIGNMYRSAITAHSDYQHKLFLEQVVGESIRTEWLKTNGMTQFLNQIDEWCISRGIRLVTPQDLIHVR